MYCEVVGMLPFRRIKAEERAKFIAFVWGSEIIQFLAALAILH